MATYYLAPSLTKFRAEIDEKWPNRDKSSDGWIGDPSHAARPSDHNPDWRVGAPRTGVVRAIDVDIDDNDRKTNLAQEVVKAALGDPRTYYVIHKFPGKPSMIWSRTYGFAPRIYTGSNPHDKHVHISILSTAAAETNTTQWLEPEKKRKKPLAIDLSSARNEFLRVIDGRRPNQNVSVRRIQRALNDKYNVGLTPDGLVGRRTLNAWGRHERRTDGLGRPRVPDYDSLSALVQPRYTLKR